MDVSGQPISPTFNRHTVQEEWEEHLGKQLYTTAYLQVSVPGILCGLLEDRTNRLSWNVGKNYKFMLHKIPEQQRSQVRMMFNEYSFQTVTFALINYLYVLVKGSTCSTDNMWQMV